MAKRHSAAGESEDSALGTAYAMSRTHVPKRPRKPWLGTAVLHIEFSTKPHWPKVPNVTQETKTNAFRSIGVSESAGEINSACFNNPNWSVGCAFLGTASVATVGPQALATFTGSFRATNLNGAGATFDVGEAAVVERNGGWAGNCHDRICPCMVCTWRWYQANGVRAGEESERTSEINRKAE